MATRQMKPTDRRSETRVRFGSGNVFADLKLPNAEELLAKARLAHEICKIIEADELTQSKAVALLGTDQPNVSRLMEARLSGFSIDRLLHFLVLLGMDASISISRPSRGHRAGLRVSAFA